MIDVSLVDDKEIEKLDNEKLKHFKPSIIYGKQIVVIYLQIPVFSNKICETIKLYPVPNLNQELSAMRLV